MPFSVGPMELVIVLVIALVILGPKRLPEAGKAIGKGMRGFKESLGGRSRRGRRAERDPRLGRHARRLASSPATMPGEWIPCSWSSGSGSACSWARPVWAAAR